MTLDNKIGCAKAERDRARPGVVKMVGDRGGGDGDGGDDGDTGNSVRRYMSGDSVRIFMWGDSVGR